MGWAPGEYLDAAVRDVLTAEESRADSTVGYAALLLAGTGATGASDRLVRRWHAVTEHPVTLLAPDPVTARAWAMLFAARGGAPDWAAALTPLDLDAEEAAHRAHLSRAEPGVPAGPLGDSTPAKIISGLAGLLEEGREPDPVRALAAEAEVLAGQGKLTRAQAVLGSWAERARRRPRPDIATVAACRHLAPFLVEGTLAEHLSITGDWADACAGDLIAALHTRYRPAPEHTGWRGLVERLMTLRTAGGELGLQHLPPPATPARVAEAEQRLGVRLPDDYREFLCACDGLPPDVVFPRLFGVSELRPAGPHGIVVSEHGETGVITLVPEAGGWLAVEWDPTLGETAHPTFRALVEAQIRLLEQIQ